MFMLFSMLDLLEDFLALRSIAYARLDGSTPRPRRTLDVKLVRHPFFSVLAPTLTHYEPDSSSKKCRVSYSIHYTAMR